MLSWGKDDPRSWRCDWCQALTFEDGREVHQWWLCETCAVDAEQADREHDEQLLREEQGND